MTFEDETHADCDDPGFVPVRNYLLYTLSLPERTLRSASGLLGGVLRESACLLVPHAFQDCKTYSIMVEQMLDFLAEDVGGVERARAESAGAAAKVEYFAARKAVGNFVEMAGLATFHLSPMLLLAVVSDVAYGSRAYLNELAGELKQQGVIAEDSTINHVDDLLEAVASAAGTTAGAFDTPPLSVEGLRQTIDDTRKAVGSIDPMSVLPQAEVARLWHDIHKIASEQGVDPLAISSAMTLFSLDRIGSASLGALSTVRAVGTLFDRHVIDHYRCGLQRIQEKGFYTTLAETSKPYSDAVWKNFSSSRSTITEDVLSGRLVGQAWSTARRWFGGK